MFGPIKELTTFWPFLFKWYTGEGVSWLRVTPCSWQFLSCQAMSGLPVLLTAVLKCVFCWFSKPFGRVTVLHQIPLLYLAAKTDSELIQHKTLVSSHPRPKLSELMVAAVV